MVYIGMLFWATLLAYRGRLGVLVRGCKGDGSMGQGARMHGRCSGCMCACVRVHGTNGLSLRKVGML